jgi:glycerol-3-phosphate dehydrogenase (NAD(P)+)
LNKRIGILGNGSWSSALAKLLTDNQQTIHWWMRNNESRQSLQETGHNPHYLSMVHYNMNKLVLYSNIAQCIAESDIILIGIPSAFAEEVLNTLPRNVFENKLILSAIKGILPGRTQLLNDYLQTEFNVLPEQYTCISGPCHAEEVAAEKLSYLTFASANEQVASTLAAYFQKHNLHTIVSTDIHGVQYAAVLKNIYALGAGIAHGLDYGDNFLSVYITNCFSEMQQFLEVASPDTRHHYNTSAYLGDLLVTCYSLHSRNRTFGNFIGKGYSVSAAKLELNMVAEGYYAARGIHEIAKRNGHTLPIAEAVFNILWEHQPAALAFKNLESKLI